MSRFRLLPLALLPLAAICLLPAGCDIQEPVRRYEVAKRVDTEDVSAEGKDRMLVAYAISEGKAWFFKMQGAKDAVSDHAASFIKLLESVHFTADGPTWTAPDGWKQLPGSAMRYATLLTHGDEPLEVSVIGLPYSGDEDGFALANVNRWRRQLQLPPIGPFQLDDVIKHFQLDGKPAVLANLVGTLADAGGPPMDSGLPPGASGPFVPPVGPAQVSPAPLGPAAPSRGDGPSYDVPEGWQPAKNDAISRVAFEAADGERRVRITVSAVGGELLANVDRWRRQVGLPPATAADLEATLSKIEVAGAAADYVQAVGPESASPRNTILGVIASAGGTTWVVKLMGDWQLAERERPHFESFVKSLKFE